jgi:hypothetical protein
MEGFKTLKELMDYNESGKKSFNAIQIPTIEKVFKKNSREEVVYNARAHEVLMTDLLGYDAIRYADVFLPYIKNAFMDKGFRMYDGAQLFTGLFPTGKASQLRFENDSPSFEIIGYSYPTEVLAAAQNDLVRVRENEVLVFMELDKNNSINLSLKMGRNFRDYLNNFMRDQQIKGSVSGLQSKTYSLTALDFNNYFDKEPTHASMMGFLLDLMGLEQLNNELINYDLLYPSEVKTFVDNYRIAGKFKVIIFIKRTQDEVINAINGSYSRKITPQPNDIHIWLVAKALVVFDRDFVIVNVGSNVVKELKQNKSGKEELQQLVLDQLKIESLDLLINKNALEKGTHKGFINALATLWLEDKAGESELNKVVFEKSPALFLSLIAAEAAIEELEFLKIKEHRWNPQLTNYNPVFKEDSLYNAAVCGFINGFIDEVKSIPELAKLYTSIKGSQEEYDKFMAGLYKIIEDGIFKTIIEAATEEYVAAIKEGNLEKLYYNLAHDSIQIVSLLLGVFQLAKGVASFLNFTRKALSYLKRYGVRSLKKLKVLDKKQLRKVFDELDDIGKNLDGVRLTRLELDDWIKVLRKLGAEVKYYKTSKRMTRYFEVENRNVGAAFNANDIPPTIWIRENPTDLELFHESMHLEDFLRRGPNYLKGQKRTNLPFGNRSQVAKRDQLISKYIKEKYVLNKILEEQNNWIKKFDKGRFTKADIQFSIDYFDDFADELIEEGIDLSKIVLKQ